MLSYCSLGYFYYFCDVEYSVNYKNFKMAMKRLFSVALVALFTLSAVSCETGNNDTQKPDNSEQTGGQGITVTSGDVINATAEHKNYQITYTVQGEGSIIATTDNPEMIDAINTNSPGYVRFRVTDNPTSEEREANIVITYGNSFARVKVVQEGAEIAEVEKVYVVANQLVGNYYGERLVDGLGHYWIILTKDGFVNGNTVAGGEYFRLDLLAPLATSEDNITLPDGDYRFDPANADEAFTIVNIGNTDYTWIDSTGEGWGFDLIDASLSVRGNKIELVALTDEKEFHVTFDGTYSLTPPYEITDYVSSLKEDTVIDVSNCRASFQNYGDYWDCGYTNWGIEFVCYDGMKNGTYVVLDLISDSATDISGTYVASGFTAEDSTKPDFRPGVFVPGFRVSDVSDLLLGSLFMVYKDGLCVSQASLYDGTITITKLGNGYYNIVIDAYDDAPKQNKITLNWTGTM
jgi:hypothetical protein